MLNVQGIRRNVKNVVKNYTDAQVKVREATSNDPWGPSSTLMSEVADLTYNVVAFSEIMQMIWKRLNDHGKNWRHVYKALVLLEYLIKTGSEKVAQQCKENIFAIQTLKDFQYIEDNKDQGMNVREKSKQLVSLLKDDERLKNERARALKAKERFAQATSHSVSEASGGSGKDSTASSPDGAPSLKELENARPQTAGEEELQLQLALAMSKEEAEQEERLRRNDDLRLQMALTESQENYKSKSVDSDLNLKDSPSSANDLLALSGDATPAKQNADPWGVTLAKKPAADPWSSTSPTTAASGADPWTIPATQTHNRVPQSASVPDDPWTSVTNGGNSLTPRMSTSASVSFEALGGRTNGEFDDHDLHNKRSAMSSPDTSTQRTTPNPFDMMGLKESLLAGTIDQYQNQSVKKTPETFLGPNSNLVNLDALVSTQGSDREPGSGNPFGVPPPPPALNNPFQAIRPQPPTINQLRIQNQFAPFVPPPPAMAVPPMVQPPVMPLGTLSSSGNYTASSATNNPFL